MRKEQQSRFLIAIAMAFIAAMLALPMSISAGNLEPSAPLGPTMKTLDQISPTWSQIISGSERFEMVLGHNAVLDKETGLVWERNPDTTVSRWHYARDYCYKKEVGRRKGWRLPTVEELASLVSMGGDGSGRKLPSGHPFSNNVQATRYWTSTSVDDLNAYYVDFADGNVKWIGSIAGNKTNNPQRVWCVRGGHGYDAFPEPPDLPY
ncbi:MAG: DUF1566 domain-containing protein [Deltaproteobacteria bacterium]|nr:MAG: DUF1566 domain-containing protein [Deltaproteobacteria bacterium]